MKNDFMEAVQARRSYYGIGKDAVVADDRIVQIVTEAVKYTPSAFNSQSARAVLLLKGQHDKFWDITMESLRRIVPENAFQATEEKINSFKSGYGTILYFEDQEVVKGLQEQFSLYKDNFPIWSQQSNGMLQMVLWTALENEGFGASLQHYTELVEAEVKKEWGVPENWKFIAQMPFGKPTVQPDKKEFHIEKEHIKVFM